MYSNPDVARFVMDNLVPVRLHAKQHPDQFERVSAQLGVEGAATAAIVQPSGDVLDRIVGMVTPQEFVARVSPLLDGRK